MVATEARRLELAKQAKDLPAIEKRVRDLEARRLRDLTRAKTAYEAKLKKVEEFERVELGEARSELADAKSAIAELTAEHVSRELVTAEAKARAHTNRLAMEVKRMRADLDQAKALVKRERGRGRSAARDMKDKLLGAEAELRRATDELKVSSAGWELARKDLDAAVANALSTDGDNGGK